MSALITGIFGLIGSIMTLIIARSESTSSAPQPVGAEVAAIAAPQVFGDAALPAPLRSHETVGAARPVNLLLNFGAFQAQLATPHVSVDERARIIRPLVGQRVVWKGYVDDVIPMDAAQSEWAITVSLVETSEKTGQSLFKTPAHFRFRADELDAVAQLVPGDQVVLTGTMTDHSIVATNVTEAHVMSVNGRPLTQTAVESPDQTSRH